MSAYFPSGKWYDWYTHEVTSATTTGETKQLDTPVDHIQVLTQPPPPPSPSLFSSLTHQVHLHGGSVIPMQDPALTTAASRANNFSLLVALDSMTQAQGDVFLDDGEAITITK